MPLLNFKKQFANAVELGLNEPDNPAGKRQTIRARRKDGRNPKPGQTLYLYTGLRTKATRKLGEAICVSSEPICITEKKDIVIGVRELTWNQCFNLAWADGFKDVHSFMEFFETVHGLPFYGFLIKW